MTSTDYMRAQDWTTHQLNELRVDQCWVNKFLKKCFFLNCMDPFYIYKYGADDERSSRFKIFLSPQLRMMTTRYDARRRIWRRWLSLMMGYFLVKFSILGAAQFLTLNSQGSSQSAGSWHHTMGQFLGNPLAPMADVSMIVYLGGSLTAYNCLVSMPQYFSKYLMNVASLRFLLDPLREARRADMLVERKIEDILASMNFYKFQLSDRLDPTCYDRQCDIVWDLLEQSRRNLLEYQSRQWIFRQQIYSHSTFKKVRAEAKCIVLLLIVVTIASFFTIVFSLILPSIAAKCSLSEGIASQCDILQLFNYREKIAIVELVVFLMFCSHTYALYYVLMLLSFGEQMKLIREMRASQTRCLRTLRQFNARRAYGFVEPEVRVDRLLMKTLITSSVTDSELRTAADCMASLVTVYLVNISYTFAILLLTESLIMESRLVRRYILIAIWINSNLIALLCASVSAQSCSLVRIHWSILAENTYRLEKADADAFANFITILWRKMVYSSSSMRKQLPVLLRSIRLTYKEVIEINFFVISLFLLVNRGS